MAPPEKKQRTDEGEQKPAEDVPAENAEMKSVETSKVDNTPKELETDAAPAKGAKALEKDRVVFRTEDTTMNVLPTSNSSMLMCLNDGGISHLVAGARANVGVSKGRYLFEAKILEMFPTPTESRSGPTRSLVRVGFAKADAHLVAGSTADSIVWDNGGALLTSKVRNLVASKFYKDQVVGIFLNLEEGHPNFQTMSLFVNGKRASQPEPLPECLKGQTLYPIISFKNATVQVNFGSEPLCPLPFNIPMVQDALKADAVVAKVSDAPAKHEVLVPVALPDEGTFDWVDMFLEKNPTYQEISDRMIMDWADKSGLVSRKFGWTKLSNDKPGYQFQVKELDDNSLKRSLLSIAPLQKRSFIIMEVKGNLSVEDRKEVMAHFDANVWNKTAVVLTGTPTKEFTERTRSLVLKAKQAAADQAWERKKADERRAKEVANKQKEAEKAKRKAEKEVKKKIEALKKSQEKAQQKAKEEAGESEEKKDETMENSTATAMDTSEPKDEEKAEEVEESKEDEEKAEDSSEEDIAEESQVDEPAPQVELTEEEKTIHFRKHEVSDLTANVLESNFSKFTLPKKDEGFTDVKYEWTKTATDCEKKLKKWVLDKKVSLRIEDLQPSQWSQQKMREFLQQVGVWQVKVREFQSRMSKKMQEKQMRDAKKAKEKALKEAMEKRAQEDAENKNKEAARKGEETKEDGEEKPTESKDNEETNENQEAKDEMKEEEPVADEPEETEEAVDFDQVDVFGITDVLDVGAGTPIFKEFANEDWSMMTLRFELHLLAHAFRQDVEDPERLGIALENLPYYYNKYFRKQLNVKDWGVETPAELVKLIEDTVFVTKDAVLDTLLDAEMETSAIFAKLTEEARRYRRVQVDLGIESAKLKITARGWAGAHVNSSNNTIGAHTRSEVIGGGSPAGAYKGSGRVVGRSQGMSTAIGGGSTWRPGMMGSPSNFGRQGPAGYGKAQHNQGSKGGFSPYGKGGSSQAGKGSWGGGGGGGRRF